MAYGKIKADTLTWDNAGTDTDITISTIPTAADLAAKLGTADIGVTVQAYDANLPAGNTILVDGDVGVGVQAYDADTAKTDVAQTFTAAQRGAITSLTGATPTPDFSASNNFKITTSGTTTVGTPTNIVAGQTGSIFIEYGGADGISFPSIFKFVGGQSSISPTSTASAIDRLDYIVLDDTSGSEVITVNFTANYVA
jgi:hypothetical protein